MRIISWNVRGLKAPNKIRFIKYQLNLMKCSILMVQETKLNMSSARSLFSSWKLWKFCIYPSEGALGGLAFLWNDYSVDLSLVASSSNWMLVLVKSKSSDAKF